MMEHDKARRAEPHAATPPDDPANPELEQEVRKVTTWFTEPGQGEKYLSELDDKIIALITQREAKAYSEGYVQGRSDEQLQEWQ